MAKRKKMLLNTEKTEQIDWSEEVDSVYGSDTLISGDEFDDDMGFLNMAEAIEPRNYVFTAMVDGKDTEIIRFDEDGHFYVRESRVEIDHEEGQTVFKAFHDWITSQKKLSM